jgi:hypothetical protein
MSPVSRARKRIQEPTPQSMNGLFKDMLRDFSSLGAEPEQLEVDLLASEVIGQWWDLPAQEADTEDTEEVSLALELIAFAGRKITLGAAALLAALRVLGETAEEREAAAAALATVLGRGIPAPDWAETLGTVVVGECWRTGDIYGDESSLLIEFAYGEARHGVLALLDFNELGGRVRDVVVVDAPEEVLAAMREQVEEDSDLVTLEQVTPAAAHQLLADGLAATDGLDEPEVSEDYARFRALAQARCRALPEPDASPDRAEISEAARDELVAEFIAAAVAGESLEDTEANRACARLIVDFGVEHEPANPARVGPEKLARFLEAVLDGEVELDEEHEDGLAPVLLSWTAWSAARAGLPESAVVALIDAVGEYLTEFGQDDSAADVYLDGTEELDGPEEIAEVLERRMFAIPSVYTELGDEELDLEPTDPEQRRLLVIGEYPEYHEAIAAETFDGQPQVELELRVNVVDQLWDNEPPEVWEAAQRLLEGGLERAEILGRIGEVFHKQLQPAQNTGNDEVTYDLDEYREALQALN